MILFAIILLILISPIMLLFIIALISPAVQLQAVPYVVTSIVFALCIGIIWGGLFQ